MAKEKLITHIKQETTQNDILRSLGIPKEYYDVYYDIFKETLYKKHLDNDWSEGF